MIKSLKRNDIRSTPFVANKSWNSQNQTFDNTISWQSGSQSGSLFLSFVDYKDGTQLSLHSSSIAYQQQDPDFLRFRIGQEITGTTFYPTSSKYYDSLVNPTNIDGTYQGLVYNTLKNLFYKETANPTQIFGLESLNPVDVNRTLTKQINVFNVPQNKFGEKIVPNSIEIKQQLDDGHFVVIDDGNTNLKLSGSHFVDVQNAMYNCVSAIVNIKDTSYTYDGSPKSASVTTNPSDLITITTYNGSETPPTNVGTYTILSTILDGYYCGSTGSTFIINKATATIAVTGGPFEYNEKPHSATVTTNPSGLTYKIEYKDSDGKDVKEPIDVGTYDATATVDDEIYEVKGTGKVTITPKQLTVTFPTIADQEYGTSDLITLNAYSDPKKFDITYSITSGQKLAKILTENGISKIQITGQNANGIINHVLGSVTASASTENLTNKNYLSANATQSFTVTPKEIILNPTVYYPGTGLNVTISTPSISSKLVVGSGDVVTITGPSDGTIASSAAGTHPVITGSSYALDGLDAPKYSLKQPTLTVTVTNTITLTDKVFTYDGKPYTIIDINPTLESNINYTIQFFNAGNEIFKQTYNSTTVNPTYVGPTNVGYYKVTITNNNDKTDTKTVNLTISKADATVTFKIQPQDSVFEHLQFNNCDDQINKLNNNGITSVTIKGVSYKDRTGVTQVISPIPTELKVTYGGSEIVPTVSGNYQIGINGTNANANFQFVLTGTPKVTFNDVIYIVYRNGHSFIQDSSPRSGVQITSSQYYTSSNHNLLKFYYPSGSVNNWSTICKNNSKLKNYKFTDYTGFSPVDLGVSFVSIGAGGGVGDGSNIGTGTVATWGLPPGSYGSGTTSPYAMNTPKDLRNVTAIAAGSDFMMALKIDGTVVMWGDTGPYGQYRVAPADLQVVNLDNPVTAIAAGGNTAAALKKDGTVVAWSVPYDYWDNMPQKLKNKKVTAIFADGGAVFALYDGGTVAAWDQPGGYGGYFREISDADGLTNMKQICTATGFGVGLKIDGTIVTWGTQHPKSTDVPDELRTPNSDNPVTAIGVGAASTVLLKKDGKIYGLYDGRVTLIAESQHLTGVTAIATGYNWYMALMSTGKVWNSQYHIGRKGYDMPGGEKLTGVTAIATTWDQMVALKGQTISVGGGGGAYVGFSMPAKYLVDNNINTMKMVTYGVGQKSPSVTAGGPAFFVTGSSYTTNSSWLGIYADGGGGTTTSVIGVGGKSYINKQIYSGSLYEDTPYFLDEFIDGNDYYETTLRNQGPRYNNEVINVGMIDEFNTAQYGFNGDLGGLNGIKRISTFETPHLRWGQGGSTNNSSMCEIRIRHSIYQIYLNGTKIYDVNNI